MNRENLKNYKHTQMWIKEITISKEKYEKLKPETKNLIKLNDVKLNFEEEK